MKIKQKSKAKNAVNDDRFMDLSSHPMFREPPRREKKMMVDERFQAMFTDKSFAENPKKVDKRGRPIRAKSAKPNKYLTQLYEVERKDDDDIDSQMKGNVNTNANDDNAEEVSHEEEDDNVETDKSTDGEMDSEFTDSTSLLHQKEITLDLARGDGNMSSSSSSAGDDEEKDIFEGDHVSAVAYCEDDPFERLERGIKRVEWASPRLALCNLEWDRLRAEDLLLALNSLKPATGQILQVAIYQSDFGVEQMDREQAQDGRPPVDLNALDNPTEQMKHEHMIRAYEIDRLRYYYAVCECDSEDTAIALYEACDGVEYEESGIRFDLRFIPAEMEFQESRLRERCSSDNVDWRRYKSKKFRSFALTNSQSKLTWDQPDPDREKFIQDAFRQETDLDAFDCLIAPESEDEEELRTKAALLLEAAQEQEDLFKTSNRDRNRVENEEGDENEDNAKGDIIVKSVKGAKVPQGIEQKDGSDDDGEAMKPDWMENANEGLDDDDFPMKKEKTSYKQYLQRKKEKKRERHQKLIEKKRRLNEEHQKAIAEQAAKKRPVHQLQFDEDTSSDDDCGKNANKNKKSKKLATEESSFSSAAALEGDQRFTALFTDSAFAIDKSHSAWKGGELAERQMRAKVSRRTKTKK